MTIQNDDAVYSHEPWVHLELVQMTSAPKGWTAESLEQWTAEFGHFVDELRLVADRRLSEMQREHLMHVLDFCLADFGDDAVARGVLDYVREYVAFHVGDSLGLTAAERALERQSLLPTRVRHYVERLAQSYWDLYEVERLTDEGFVLRRLHDDARELLHAPEYNQPFIIGHVVALRLIDLGPLVAAPLSLQLDCERVALLVNELESEFVRGRYREEQWAEFLFHRGSFLILRHAMVDFRSYDALGADEDLSSPSGVAIDRLVRLQDAFGALEQAVVASDAEQSAAALIVAGPEGSVIRVEDTQVCAALLVFEDSASHAAYARYMDGEVTSEVLDQVAFRRAWRLPFEEAHPDDLLRLERVGSTLGVAGIVAPSRVEAGFVAEDAPDDDVERLIEACYRVAAMLAGGKREAA
ncbi:MAG: hypothetical protein H0U74_04870 [Bradymonadaceae bacterium]|nr:hypothetical protein [Lujinxingiaceae bacterium]